MSRPPGWQRAEAHYPGDAAVTVPTSPISGNVLFNNSVGLDANYLTGSDKRGDLQIGYMGRCPPIGPRSLSEQVAQSTPHSDRLPYQHDLIDPARGCNIGTG